jgi:hypothetical protein
LCFPPSPLPSRVHFDRSPPDNRRRSVWYRALAAHALDQTPWPRLSAPARWRAQSPAAARFPPVLLPWYRSEYSSFVFPNRVHIVSFTFLHLLKAIATAFQQHHVGTFPTRLAYFAPRAALFRVFECILFCRAEKFTVATVLRELVL